MKNINDIYRYIFSNDNIYIYYINMENIGTRIYQYHTYKEAINKYINELISKYILQINLGSPRYEIFGSEFNDNLGSKIRTIKKNILGYELEINLDDINDKNINLPAFTILIKKSLLDITNNIEGVVYENRIISDNILPYLDLSIPKGPIKNITIFEIFWDQLYPINKLNIDWLTIGTDKKKIKFNTSELFNDFLHDYIINKKILYKNYLTNFNNDSKILYCYYKNFWYHISEFNMSPNLNYFFKKIVSSKIKFDINIKFFNYHKHYF